MFIAPTSLGFEPWCLQHLGFTAPLNKLDMRYCLLKDSNPYHVNNPLDLMQDSNERRRCGAGHASRERSRIIDRKSFTRAYFNHCI